MSERDQVLTGQNQVTDGEAELDTMVEADSLVEEVSIDGMCGVY